MFIYVFNINEFDAEKIMESGHVASFEYEDRGGKTFMIITTDVCCDHWFD